MKKIIVLLLLVSSISFAQKKEEANKLVGQGVTLNDAGKYEEAIKKYDEALKIDQNNFLALAEKAYTLLVLNKPSESAELCQLALEKHPDAEDLASVYVTYGNSLDALKKRDKAIEIYDQGIKLYPDNYMLHFNKGISLATDNKVQESILCFEKALTINPKHPGSHNALARMMKISNNDIAALLAFSRFLILEPQTKRASENLQNVKNIMSGGAEKTGKKSVTISVSADMLTDTTSDGKKKENNFSSTALILAMTAALDFDKKNAKKSDVENFIRKFETVCASLTETKKDNYGFFWDYYVPYFIEMKEKNLIETFAYIIFITSDDKKINKWITSHQSEVADFYDWSKKYSWSK